MHTRTKRDRQYMRPLTFPPYQKIANADGDTFERRGGVPLAELPIEDRPLVLTTPDMIVEPAAEARGGKTWEPSIALTAAAIAVLLVFFLLAIKGLLAMANH